MKNLVNELRSGIDSRHITTGDDIKELLPREIAKVKRTLAQLDIELGLVHTLSDEI